MGGEALLAIDDLVTRFDTAHGTVNAVDGVSFELEAGRTLGLVGESGCGKSVTALSIMRLVPSPPGTIARGRVLFRGTDLLALSEREMCGLRGNELSLVFQEPMSSLNPVFTVGQQLAEPIRLHRGASRAEAREVAERLLHLVGIDAPRERLRCYPHELSGGMRQRAVIAMALACEPALLIADEPTTALDVTVQAQILELLRAQQERLGMGVLLITHDLGVIAESCDDVAVMYAGRVVEQAATRELFARPRHPYTAGLLRSMPRPLDEPVEAAGSRARLHAIPGAVPALHALPPGCPFQDRCHAVRDRCRDEAPALAVVGDSRVRCHFPLEARP